MRRKAPVFLLMFLVNCTVFGQRYIPYYHLCNEADKEIFDNNYQLALCKLEKAFEIADYVHAAQYEKASKCAILIGDFEKAFFFAKKSIVNSSDNHFWKVRKFKNFRLSKYGRALIDSIGHYQQVAASKVNNTYLNFIDSLYYVDQNVIRGNKMVRGNYEIDKSRLPDDLFKLDSTNLNTLLQLIKVYGFPSERILGVNGYQKAAMIIHHNLRLEQNEKYHSVVITALFNGEYLPNDFELMYEQYSMWFKNTTFFTTFDRNLLPSNLSRINENRLRYGLKDLSAYKIKRNGLVMRAKW